MKAHRMTLAVPVIEIADETDSPCVGRPHSEVNAAHTIDDSDVGTELFVVAIVRPFVQQMEVVVREQGREAVRIVKLPRVPEPVGGLQSIGETFSPVSESQFEETFIAELLHRVLRRAIRLDDRNAFSFGNESAHDDGLHLPASISCMPRKPNGSG